MPGLLWATCAARRGLSFHRTEQETRGCPAVATPGPLTCGQASQAGGSGLGTNSPACFHPRGSTEFPKVLIRDVAWAGAWLPGCEWRL